MKTIAWKPRNPISLWNEGDEWLEDFWKSAPLQLPEVFRRQGYPAVNLSDDGNEFVATFDVPAMEEKDLEVQVMGSQLVLKGERKWENEKKEKECFRSESQYGMFQRSIPLPEGLNVEPKAMVAKLEKGVLEVRIPKLEPEPATRIKIEARR
ncbi:MAG: Hsp20/alpha crystallin family protein [Planctomycetota bacterium]